MDENISQCFVEQKVNEVVVSIHGGPGTENMLRYSKCGADYQKVLENTQQLIEIRNCSNSKYPIVKVKTVLFDWNDTDELMNQLRKDTQKIGVDHLYWVLDWEKGGLSHSSKRFTQNSKELDTLIEKDEYRIF